MARSPGIGSGQRPDRCPASRYGNGVTVNLVNQDAIQVSFELSRQRLSVAVTLFEEGEVDDDEHDGDAGIAARDGRHFRQHGGVEAVLGHAPLLVGDDYLLRRQNDDPASAVTQKSHRVPPEGTPIGDAGQTSTQG